MRSESVANWSRLFRIVVGYRHTQGWHRRQVLVLKLAHKVNRVSHSKAGTGLSWQETGLVTIIFFLFVYFTIVYHNSIYVMRGKVAMLSLKVSSGQVKALQGLTVQRLKSHS